jgi:hypothetical protein
MSSQRTSELAANVGVEVNVGHRIIIHGRDKSAGNGEFAETTERTYDWSQSGGCVSGGRLVCNTLRACMCRVTLS